MQGNHATDIQRFVKSCSCACLDQGFTCTPSLQTPDLTSPAFFSRPTDHHCGDRQLCTVPRAHSPSYIKYSNTVPTCFQTHCYPREHCVKPKTTIHLHTQVGWAFIEKLGISIRSTSGYNRCTKRERTGQLPQSFCNHHLENAHVSFHAWNMHKTSCTIQSPGYDFPVSTGLPATFLSLECHTHRCTSCCQVVLNM